MKKNIIRVIAAFLCLAVLVSLCSELVVRGIYAKEDCDLILTHNDAPVDQIHLRKNDAYLVKVSGGHTDYKWQIWKENESLEKKGSGVWVTIQGCTGKEINVTFALISSMLNKNNSAKIRACSSDESGDLLVSNELKIAVVDDKIEKVDESLAPAMLRLNQVQASEKTKLSPGIAAVTSTQEYVTITINYKFKDGGKAFDPYVATLVRGTSFTTTVASPSIIGYDPVVEDYLGNIVGATEVDIDYSNGINSDVVINVIYQPAPVNYTVRYFFQNIFDDSYSENTSYMVSAKGYTGDQPDFAHFNIAVDGYSVLTSDRDEIAADGSSEYQVFYNRNYYLMNFQLDGGYGVEPIYAKYGSHFVVNTPIKHGYVFAGWDRLNTQGVGDGVADALPATIQSKNESYKALWTAEDTTYQVVYWKENPDDNGYSYWGRETLSAKSSNRVSGSDRAKIIGLDDARYFKYNAEKTDKNIIVEGDGSTVVNVYYTRNVYTMKFYYAKAVTSGSKATYYVAGGSTWAFATCGSTDISTMLSSVGSWGAVKTLPVLNEEGESRGYTTGSETHNNQTFYYFQFSGKYDSDISEIWPVGVFDSVGTSQTNDFGDTAYFSAWNVEHHTYYSHNNTNKTLKGNYLRLDYQMLYDAQHEDVDTVRFLAFWENGADNIGWNKPNKWYYNIHLPVLEGEAYDSTYNGVNYKLSATYWLYDNNTNSNPEEQTATAVEGFTNFTRVAKLKEVLDSYYGINAYTMDFYYRRNQYKLEFTNHDSVVKTESRVPYEMPLKNYAFTPAYPSTLEKGAYVFGGWYTSPGCYDGTEVDWDTLEMPASDLMLYAKWTPVEHDVIVYETYADAVAGRNVYAEFEVQHRNTVNPPVSFVEPTKSGYSFMGWFCIDETGNKLAFNFQDFAVTKDLIVFADWSSDIVVPYEVKYVFTNGSGVKTTIADTTAGLSFAGDTKTFKAKAGKDLYAGYTEHYYPRTNNHSIFMDQVSENNVFEFEYIYLDKVPYTVKYVNKITGETLRQDKYVADNEQAVVSEKFEYIKDFVPDAYYKRLVLSADQGENVITFYYVPDSAHAYYAVRHLVQDENGGFSEYAVIEGVGDVGSDISVDPLQISGFTYAPAMSISSGKIVPEGLLLELYYTRNVYRYTVNYLEYGTDKVLAKQKIGTAAYGETITETAVTVDGYLILGENTVSIKVRDSGAANIINFYYRLPEVKILYKVVAEGDGDKTQCKVSISQEVIYASDKISGSTPIVTGNNYRFDGWYTDEACTVAVDKSWVKEDGFLIPVLASAVYYAKFVETKASLIIENSGADMEKDKNQSFLYIVKGKPGSKTEHIDLILAVKGNESLTINDLPLGDYTVAEASGWSFRYTPDEETKTVTLSQPGGVVSVTFTEDRDMPFWLDGNAYCGNKFGPQDR